MMQLVAMLFLATATAHSHAQHGPVGNWANPSKSVVMNISDCKGHLCGTVVWASEKPGDASKGTLTSSARDLLTNVKEMSHNHWKGKIFVPDQNMRVTAKLAMVSHDQLNVSGCAPMICKSQVWHGRTARPFVTTVIASLPATTAAPYCAAKCKRERMTQFDDRERAFETKFAHDEEMKFRITARRNRLLGEWAARQMGLSEAESESYAKDVVRSDFEEAGEHDVVRKVLGDLTSAGVDCDEDKVVEALRNKEIDARRQIIEAPTSRCRWRPATSNA